MKIFNFLRKTEKKANSGQFSEFFLSAPKEKKEEVLEEVARMANEDQREVFNKSRLKAKAR